MARPLACIALVAGLAAADPAVAPAPVPAAQPTAPAAPPTAAPSPDPTAAVVAEGRFLYRQRDLDALMLVAARHARQKLSRSDEDALRQALIQALTAREDLVTALERLPPTIAGKARDALVLDLLDYQAEPTPAKAIRPGGETAPTAPDAPAPAAPTAPAQEGPVMVRLPDLVLSRPVDGGKRAITIGLALYFADHALSKQLEAKALLVQDAILGHLHQLPAKDLVEPNQIALKDGLIKAVQARVPEFPADGLLIPQLEVGPVEK